MGIYIKGKKLDGAYIKGTKVGGMYDKGVKIFTSYIPLPVFKMELYGWNGAGADFGWRVTADIPFDTADYTLTVLNPTDYRVPPKWHSAGSGVNYGWYYFWGAIGNDGCNGFQEHSIEIKNKKGVVVFNKSIYFNTSDCLVCEANDNYPNNRFLMPIGQTDNEYVAAFADLTEENASKKTFNGVNCYGTLGTDIREIYISKSILIGGLDVTGKNWLNKTNNSVTGVYDNLTRIFAPNTRIEKIEHIGNYLNSLTSISLYSISSAKNVFRLAGSQQSNSIARDISIHDITLHVANNLFTDGLWFSYNLNLTTINGGYMDDPMIIYINGFEGEVFYGSFPDPTADLLFLNIKLNWYEQDQPWATDIVKHCFTSLNNTRPFRCHIHFETQFRLEYFDSYFPNNTYRQITKTVG